MKTRWNITTANPQQQNEFADKLKISPVLAGVLLKRKFDLESAQIFLDEEKQPFYDPFLLPDMHEAVDRIRTAVYEKELITIFGDYDVDGITSTAVLYKTLRELGAAVEYYLPDRQTEGYGLHKEAVDKFINKTKLLITVDCGIRSIDEAAYAGGYMDVIVTDHHVPGDKLPEAIAVIDPKCSGCKYPDENLAGVGVSFKLCQALWENIRHESFTKYLDIVALGTVADIVPLTGENRKIVKRGLSAIQNCGLIELITVCNLQKDNITAGHIGFIIGPRLNAAGRLKHAGIGVELLLTEDKIRAHELAVMLDDENKIRQQLVEETFIEAAETVRQNGYDKKTMIVVAGADWHQGIIGIVASRLVDEFYRPAIVISMGKDGIGKGSCRSIKGFDICGALTACSDKLLAFGGHTMAAGLTVNVSGIDDFRKSITEYADGKLGKEDLLPLIEIDQVLRPEAVDKNLVDSLSLLEPFGMGNPAPLFLCGDIMPDNIKKIGRNNEHLKFMFSVNEQKYTAIGWNIGEYAETIENKKIDFVFQPDINKWNDKEYIQFKIKDMKISKSEEQYPTHDMIGQVYICLKRIDKKNGGLVGLDLKEISTLYEAGTGKAINEKTIQYCITVLSEIDIIAADTEKNIIRILPMPKKKKDINTSAAFLQRYM